MKSGKMKEGNGVAIKLLVIALGSVTFGVVIPACILLAAAIADLLLGLPGFRFVPVNYLAGPVLAASGVYYMVRSVLAHHYTGKGTPMPLMPSQHLITMGPYRECRNPMALGNTLYFLGITLYRGSISAVALAAAVSIIIILYNRIFEEKELARRFGQEYLRYRNRVPFIIPRLRGHRDRSG